MRACFMGPTVCALGYGVAILQSPGLEAEAALEQETKSDSARPGRDAVLPTDFDPAQRVIPRPRRGPTLP
jgi:hypothetical protein